MLITIRKIIILLILISLGNVSFIFANSNIIYPDTSHLYHANIEQSKLRDKLRDANVADIVHFGQYEQDNNIANGKEPIEWIVLEINKTTNQALLISKYILDCIRFNGFSEPVTWENSSLREYLNSELIYYIFNDDEIKCIIDNYNYNDSNVYAGSDSGNDTIDKLYIPSIYDMYQYFTDENLSTYERYQELLKPNFFRTAIATPYAINNGVRIMGSGRKYPYNGNYFLRTKGPNVKRIWYNDVYESNFISYVSELGEIKPEGTGISSSDDGIRLMIKVQF